MPTAIRIWKVTTDGSLSSLPNTQINSEAQLETWLEQDISIISTDYMVIGRQVSTDFGGVIDLPCLDSSGDIVVGVSAVSWAFRPRRLLGSGASAGATVVAVCGAESRANHYQISTSMWMYRRLTRRL